MYRPTERSAPLPLPPLSPPRRCPHVCPLSLHPLCCHCLVVIAVATPAIIVTIPAASLLPPWLAVVVASSQSSSSPRSRCHCCGLAGVTSLLQSSRAASMEHTPPPAVSLLSWARSVPLATVACRGRRFVAVAIVALQLLSLLWPCRCYFAVVVVTRGFDRTHAAASCVVVVIGASRSYWPDGGGGSGRVVFAPCIFRNAEPSHHSLHTTDNLVTTQHYKIET